MSKQHDADELAKFFQWLWEVGRLEPFSAEAQHLCEQFKNGKTIIITEQCETK